MHWWYLCLYFSEIHNIVIIAKSSTRLFAQIVEYLKNESTDIDIIC